MCIRDSERGRSSKIFIPWLAAISSSPFWRMRQLKEHLTSFWDEQYTFAFAIGKLLSSDSIRISITQIHFPALFLGNLRGHRDLRAAILDPIFKRPQTPNMRRMRQ